MRNKVRWGVLGAAQIAVQKVIPAMQQGEWSEISAIASRDRHKAEAAASALGIAKAWVLSFEKLQSGRRRSGFRGLGPRNSTPEAAEQRGATFGGGGGGKGVAQREHCSIYYVPDTWREKACARGQAVCGGEFAANI